MNGDEQPECGYEDVEVDRVPHSYIRLQQFGDGTVSEVFIHRSNLEHVIKDMRSAAPETDNPNKTQPPDHQ